MSTYDARAARAKRPLPLWVDAFQRDCALLEADELGAYVSILMAMWSSKAVALPNEPRKLARAARVSVKLWNGRVGSAISEFLTECQEGVTQKRLRHEAAEVEAFLQAQSDRRRRNGEPQGKHDSALIDSRGDTNDGTQKTPENLDKLLEYNNPPSTVDEPPINHGTHLPNMPTVVEEEEDAGARQHDIFFAVLDAAGVRSAGILPSGWMPPAAEIHVRRWSTDLGLTIGEITSAVRACRNRWPDPPRSPKAFDHAMKSTAAAKAAPPMKPATSQRTGALRNDRSTSDAEINRIADGLSAGTVDISHSSRDPFAKR